MNKTMYAHALRGMAQELQMVAHWEQTSEGALRAVSAAYNAMTDASWRLKGGGEALEQLRAASTALDEASYRAMPERAQGICAEALEQVNYIRAELGYL